MTKPSQVYGSLWSVTPAKSPEVRSGKMPRVSTDRAARWLAAGEAEDTTSGYSSLFIVLFLLFHIQLFSYFLQLCQ